MSGIFQTATKEAIREIIMEYVEQNRFGFVLTENNLTKITEEVACLFETALNLRTRVYDKVDAANNTYKKQLENQSKVNNNEFTRTSTILNRQNKDYNAYTNPQLNDFPITKEGAEIYKAQNRAMNTADVLPPEINFKLPRKKITVSEEEKERLLRR